MAAGILAPQMRCLGVLGKTKSGAFCGHYSIQCYHRTTVCRLSRELAKVIDLGGEW
jgi:hypothetical protein